MTDPTYRPEAARLHPNFETREPEIEPTAAEVQEYRLDARDPENRRLNWDEWRAHRALDEAPDES